MHATWSRKASALLLLASVSCSQGSPAAIGSSATSAPRPTLGAAKEATEVESLLKQHHLHQLMMRELSKDEQVSLRWQCAERLQSTLQEDIPLADQRLLKSKLIGIYNSLGAWAEALGVASQLADQEQEPNRAWIWNTAVAEAAKHLNQAGQLTNAELIEDLEAALNTLKESGASDATAASKRVWLSRNLAGALAHSAGGPSRVRGLYEDALDTLEHHSDIPLAESIRMSTLSDFLDASIVMEDDKGAMTAMNSLEAAGLPSTFTASRVFKYCVFAAKGNLETFWSCSKTWLDTRPEPSLPVCELQLNCARTMYLMSENQATLALTSDLLGMLEDLGPSTQGHAKATLESDAAALLGRAALAEGIDELVNSAWRTFSEAETVLRRTGDTPLSREGFVQFISLNKVSSPLAH